MAKKNKDKIDEKIEYFEKALAMGGGSENEQVNQVNYSIFCAIASVTTAFKNIYVRAEPKSNLIIVKIRLRRLAKLKLKFLKLDKFMDWQRELWRREAIDNCQEFIPGGFRLWAYYEKGEDGKFL